MSAPFLEDPLAKLVPTDARLVKALVVKITAVDLADGTCTIDANDDGGTITDVPFYVNDPVVDDRCLALQFDSMITVLGNQPLKNKISTDSDVVTAGSGFAIVSSYVHYAREVATLYVNVQRTGTAITAGASGNL